MSSWRLEADLDLCQGHQMCVLEDPGTFAFDQGTDKVVVLRPVLDATTRPAALLAVKNCPAMALTITGSVEED